jgi:hypothetical protein
LRNLKTAVFFLILGLLSGCLFTPKPYYTTQPIIVGESRALHFWQPIRQELKADLSEFTTSSVSIVLEYTIDSNGNVFEPKIVEQSVEGEFEELILKEVEDFKFKATPRNIGEQPVITRSAFIVNH